MARPQLLALRRLAALRSCKTPSECCRLLGCMLMQLQVVGEAVNGVLPLLLS